MITGIKVLNFTYLIFCYQITMNQLIIQVTVQQICKHNPASRQSLTVLSCIKPMKVDELEPLWYMLSLYECEALSDAWPAQTCDPHEHYQVWQKKLVTRSLLHTSSFTTSTALSSSTSLSSLEISSEVRTFSNFTLFPSE